LPHSYLDPFHTNDPFLFLFRSDRITVNVESQTCLQLIAQRYDRIVKACLSVIKHLNLSMPNISTSYSSSSSYAQSNNISNSGTNFYSNSSFQSSQSSTSSSNIPTMQAPLINSVLPPPPQSTFRCIQETIMELLPRLAKFNPRQFNTLYLKESVSFLSNLNNNTSYLASTSTNSSYTSSSSSLRDTIISKKTLSSSNISGPSLSSQIGSINNSITGLSSGATFCLGTLKSEVIFCVGFMSLALSNTSDEFRSYAKQFIEIFRSSPLMNSREIQRKKQTMEKDAQINELNSIMACVAMFANSMVSKTNTSNFSRMSSSSSTGSTNSSENSIIDSIMVLLEPLMLGSGGVTYTMRYFLNVNLKKKLFLIKKSKFLKYYRKTLLLVPVYIGITC
jgi:hypothetical protein